MLCFFFFKQKTSYEMRISDWSSDVCSSDLRAGATVVVGARKVEQAQAVADEAVVAGAPAALALAVDVRASASVDAFVAQGVAAFGRIDGAVNNAGVEGRMCALHDAGDDDYADILDVNASGLF